MNPELIHNAKNNAKEIKQETNHILPDHQVIFHETTIGFQVSQFWAEWIPHIRNGITFGSHKLTLKQVKGIIQDTEYLEFL